MEAAMLTVVLLFLGTLLFTGGNTVDTYEKGAQSAGGEPAAAGCGSKLMLVGLLLALPAIVWVAGILVPALPYLLFGE